MKFSKTQFLPRKATPEVLVKNDIKSYLNLFDWFFFHIQQGMGSYKGIPDMIAIKKGLVLFIEAKAPNGQQSNWQKAFEEKLKRNGGHYVLARSSKDVEDYLKREGLLSIVGGKTLF